ncbi:hypothetical protein EVAR_82295_1 [Eumeta japonica]|uniref:Uncharacterized protein n=1 Tax=Eumeta variegata TaxID=151549 RepID=A0A4C1VYI9_EUMVA|nr:hypothetical protein EVAR_82295_1 [Eumeta japonica]
MTIKFDKYYIVPRRGRIGFTFAELCYCSEWACPHEAHTIFNAAAPSAPLIACEGSELVKFQATRRSISHRKDLVSGRPNGGRAARAVAEDWHEC